MSRKNMTRPVPALPLWLASALREWLGDLLALRGRDEQPAYQNSIPIPL